MKFWSSEHVFNHKWENVAFAQTHKYPNPYNPSVVGFDVVDRRYSSSLSQLYSHRIMKTQFTTIPIFMTLLGGDSTVYVSEHSWVNAKEKSLHLKSRNLNWNDFITVEESLTYTPHPKDDSRTLLKQSASICVSGVPLADWIESHFVNGFNAKSGEGRKAIEWIIDNVKKGVENVASSLNDDLASTAAEVNALPSSS